MVVVLLTVQATFYGDGLQREGSVADSASSCLRITDALPALPSSTQLSLHSDRCKQPWNLPCISVGCVHVDCSGETAEALTVNVMQNAMLLSWMCSSL